MKVAVFFYYLLSCISSLAQLEETTAPPKIVGSLAGEPVLTQPPQAPPPTPRLIIPEENTLSSKIYQAEGRSITIQEVAPVELPPRTYSGTPMIDEQKKARFANRPPVIKREIITLSATVYDNRATHIVWRGADTNLPFEAWSNVDFGYLRGVSHILSEDKSRSYLYLGMGDVDTEKMATRYAKANRTYRKPVIPALPKTPETESAFIVTKGNPGPADLAKIQILHDLYESEHARLKAAAEHVKSLNELRAAENRANPPKAPDVIIRHWSTSGQKTLASKKGKLGR